MYAIDFLLVYIALKTVEHAVEGHFGGVGNEGEDRVLGVVVDGSQHRFGELLTQLLAFLVDVAIVSTTEVDAFE